MRPGRVVVIALLAVWLTLPRLASAATNEHPSAVLSDAPLLALPGVDVPERNLHQESDSNSPLHWDGDTLFVFNSYEHSWRSTGPDLFHLGNRIRTRLEGLNDKLPIWIEATWKDETPGRLYAAYHYEPDLICFSNRHLPTMPKIGWMWSEDNGATWEDMGFIIEAKPCAIKCDTQSPWDAGGAGDFVFIPDAKKEFFYFFGTSYDPRLEEQGVWAARMRVADRDNPVGKVWKWHKGAWSEPARWGHVTPVFPAERDYHREDGSMFWGPAVHWNTYLNAYVMLLNHAVDTKLTADGIFISYNLHVDDPAGWSKPVMIISRAELQKAVAGASVSSSVLTNGWYPQVIGAEKGETDKIVGRTGRFFMGGISRKKITFLKPGEPRP